jgi:hypothetical protein
VKGEEKMKKLVLILFIWAMNSNAAVPTMEGLFRGGENQDLAGNFIILKLMVEKLERREQEKKFLTFFFSLEKEKKIEFLQLKSPQKNMQPITDIHHDYNLLWRLRKDGSERRVLFYALLSALALNNSKSLAYYLKKKDRAFKTNRESFYWEKLKLLKSYKRYLVEKRKDSNFKGDSPLESKDIKKQEKINEVLKAPLYRPSDKVRLIRQENHFYWKLEVPTFMALFDNKTHFITEFRISLHGGNIGLRFGDFIHFNGIHFLPREILMDDLNGKKYKITFMSYRALNNPKKGIRERYKEFKKMGEEKYLKQDVLFEEFLY